MPPPMKTCVTFRRSLRRISGLTRIIVRRYLLKNPNVRTANVYEGVYDEAWYESVWAGL